MTEYSEIPDSLPPNLEKLHAYAQTRLALADQLRIVRQGLGALGRESGARQCGELMVKLAEDRFVLAVLGQFKRGKSSLMNAIIGRELLPTGVLPLTSVITVLKYGPVERLVVHREDSIFPLELPVSALGDYVTEKGNPNNQKKVKAVAVELPVPFLHRGVEFVDTPGVGSAITANTATTYRFLPDCDAVLFVTGADALMTNLELEFLQQIREYVDRIFFVVNKIDLVADAERSEVLAFATDTLRAQLGSDAVKLFPVSSRLGLTARLSDDADLYVQSGLKSLEEALVSFLSGEKTATFLAAVAQKALRILADETAQGAFGESALEFRVQAIQAEKSLRLRTDPHLAASAVAVARAKLEALYTAIVDDREGTMPDREVLPPAVTEPGPGKDVPTGDTTPISLPEAEDTAPEAMAGDLQATTCPVCQHIARQTFDFFARWQYQLSAEESAQVAFAAEGGFCPLHTWQLLDLASPYGASVGFARWVAQIADRLKARDNELKGGDTMRRSVHDARSCRVCTWLREVEVAYVRGLIALTDKPGGRDRYRLSQGACLRHLAMLLDAASSAESRGFLRSHAIQRFEQDMEDMRSYAMKRDALRRALNEEDAYRRATIRIVGDRRVCLP